MTALAAIKNPLKVDEILTFYQNSTNSLDVQMDNFPIRKKDGGPIQKGFMKNPSSIASIVHDDMVQVWGVTKIPDPVSSAVNFGHKAIDKFAISLLSPIYRPLPDAITASGALAGVSDQKKAWLYYLSQNDNLIEYPLGENGEPRVLEDVKAHEKSNLATCIVGDTRHVFYQSPEGAINAYNTKEGAWAQAVKKNMVQVGSGLAALVLSDGTEVLYHSSRSNPGNLMRAQRLPGEEWPTQSTALDPVVGDFSKFSVLEIAKNQTIVYYTKPDSSIGTYQDDLL